MTRPAWSVVESDCIEAMRAMPASFVDSIVTDPPYELGFMGKRWDSTGIAYSVDLWREALRVLKPGGHLLAFGGTRTYHRMACAIEDAGFDIRDSLHWVYGSGFPKSLSLDGDWAGWGTALKPAHEPIAMARKPLGATVAASLQAWGTGALNVAASRTHGPDVSGDRVRHGGGAHSDKIQQLDPDKRNPIPPGRWPTNLLLTHLLGCHEAVCEPGCPVLEMDAQGGAGGASRFFPCFRYTAKPSRKERDRGLEGLPAATAGEATDRKEGSAGLRSPRAGAGRTGGAKNTHPTVKPVALMEWLVRLVTPPGGLVLDPFLGSGTTGMAAVGLGFSFLGVERDPGYADLARRRIVTSEKDAPKVAHDSVIG